MARNHDGNEHHKLTSISVLHNNRNLDYREELIFYVETEHAFGGVQAMGSGGPHMRGFYGDEQGWDSGGRHAHNLGCGDVSAAGCVQGCAHQ